MSGDWNDIELQAAVDAYVEMHRLESLGTPFTKKRFYGQLADRFGRTVKSYEYRMQNISYVYSLQGRRWVAGLKPACHVGANVIRKLERMIAKAEGQSLGGVAGFDAAMAHAERKPPAACPKGNVVPATSETLVTQYARDPNVASWVLSQATGRCECCREEAPFVREDGRPYLEIHHVRRLADGGEDTAENTVAVCPNCHRELHFGIRRQALVQALLANVPRLSKNQAQRTTALHNRLQTGD